MPSQRVWETAQRKDGKVQGRKGAGAQRKEARMLGRRDDEPLSASKGRIRKTVCCGANLATGV